jgi:hypothetical protein
MRNGRTAPAVVALSVASAVMMATAQLSGVVSLADSPTGGEMTHNVITAMTHN